MTFEHIKRDWNAEFADHLGEDVPAKSKPRLPIFDLSKLNGPPPPERGWILQDYIPEGEITLFTGYGGSGKSLFSQQMATCIASGTDMLGIPVQRRRVLYVTAEDDESELHRRQRDIMAHLGNPDIGDRVLLSSVRGRENRLFHDDPANFCDGQRIKFGPEDDLRQTIEVTGAQVVILDNVAHLFGGNENDRGEVTAFVNSLYGLVRGLDVSIVLIGHPNKSGDSYSGSTAWLNAMRSQIELSRPEGDGVSIDPDLRVLSLGKANYARAGAQVSFRYHQGAYALDDELPVDTRHELEEAARVSGENEVFLDCLRVRTAQGEGRLVGPSSGPNYAVAQFVEMREAKGLSKPTLKKAMERLFASGRIETHTYRNTAKGRDVTIIREVSEPSPNATPNASRTQKSASPNAARTAPEHPPAHTPISKDIEGRGRLDGPPPSNDQTKDEACRRCSGTGCEWCEQ